MNTASRCFWLMPRRREFARRGYATRDETRAADVSLSNAHGEVLGEVGNGLAVIEKIVEAGIAATAAETVGAMEAMNEMTLEYSKTRVQFGQPIGLLPGRAAPAVGHVHDAGTRPQHGDAGHHVGG